VKQPRRAYGETVGSRASDAVGVTVVTYTSIRFPAPQYSVASPEQGMLQSVIAASSLPESMEFPQ
jgi:hypothetical protein